MRPSSAGGQVGSTVPVFRGPSICEARSRPPDTGAPGPHSASPFAALKDPGQEIRHQRIQMVAHLLSSTGAKLEDIARNCGYYSVDTLINSFRNEFGTTPGKYRKAKRMERA